MRKRIVKLIVVVALLLALSVSVAGSGHAHALIACPPLHRPCTGGGIVCVDRHGHVHRFHGHIHPGWHCIAI